MVIHGPEIIDSGHALRLLDYLEKFGRVRAALGGTMGRAAVIDAGLGERIESSSKRLPSDSLKDLQSSSDLIVLLNQAKSRESGMIFGSMVASRAGLSVPVLQIDCGGRFTAVLSSPGARGRAIASDMINIIDTDAIASEISRDLGLDLLQILAKERNSNASADGKIIIRKITGVLPGEKITINGKVVATATSTSVLIKAVDGKISEINGADIKLHGLEKLTPSLDLEKAIIRSGTIRRTKAEPRVIPCLGNEAVLIDHCAEEAFELAKGACAAVIVGDDTTTIAGDILYRLGVPYVGIIDGDIDGISLSSGKRPEGSVVLKLKPGYDDVVGKRIKQKIFQGGFKTSLNFEALIRAVTSIAGDLIVETDKSHS